MTARQLRIGLGLLVAALGFAGCASTTHGSASNPTAATSTAPSTSALGSTPAVASTSSVPSTSAAPKSSARPARPTPTRTPPSSRPSTPQPTPTVHKVAPEATAPAAGGCARFAGSQVLVLINPDVPSPRCTIVTAGQHLAVRNNTGELGQTPRTVTLNWADYAPRTLPPGALTTYLQPFGNYLLPGVHRVQASVYGQSGAEIWLQH